MTLDIFPNLKNILTYCQERHAYFDQFSDEHDCSSGVFGMVGLFAEADAEGLQAVLQCNCTCDNVCVWYLHVYQRVRDTCTFINVCMTGAHVLACFESILSHCAVSKRGWDGFEQIFFHSRESANYHNRHEKSSSA